MVTSVSFARVVTNHKYGSPNLICLVATEADASLCVCARANVCMCGPCAAIGVNLSFVREIASAKGNEYNALGVQNNKKNDRRTNMRLCKDYLVRRAPMLPASFCVVLGCVL